MPATKVCRGSGEGRAAILAPVENGQGSRGGRATRERLKRRAATAAEDSRIFRGHLADAELALLLDDIWALQCADKERLLALCGQAVERAHRRSDRRGTFWARLSRALLARRHQPLEQSREDLDVATELAPHMSEPRAQRLIGICDAALLHRRGFHQQAFDQFTALVRNFDL